MTDERSEFEKEMILQSMEDVELEGEETRIRMRTLLWKWFASITEREFVEFSNWFEDDPEAPDIILSACLSEYKRRGIPWEAK